MSIGQVLITEEDEPIVVESEEQQDKIIELEPLELGQNNEEVV